MIDYVAGAGIVFGFLLLCVHVDLQRPGVRGVWSASFRRLSWFRGGRRS